MEKFKPSEHDKGVVVGLKFVSSEIARRQGKTLSRASFLRWLQEQIDRRTFAWEEDG